MALFRSSFVQYQVGKQYVKVFKYHTSGDIAKAWSNKPVMWSLYSDDGYHFLASFSPRYSPKHTHCYLQDVWLFDLQFSVFLCTLHHASFDILESLNAITLSVWGEILNTDREKRDTGAFVKAYRCLGVKKLYKSDKWNFSVLKICTCSPQLARSWPVSVPTGLLSCLSDWASGL